MIQDLTDPDISPDWKPLQSNMEELTNMVSLHDSKSYSTYNNSN